MTQVSRRIVAFINLKKMTVQGYPRPALGKIADQRQLIELRTQDAYDLQVETTSEHDECKTFSLGKNNFEQKIQF